MREIKGLIPKTEAINYTPVFYQHKESIKYTLQWSFFFFFWVLYYCLQAGKTEACNRMCIAAQLGAPTSGTAMFDRCLLSGTAGSFLSERFPWAVYIQPPKPMLSPSVRSYSDQLPTFQPSFSFLLWLEHTQKGEDTHTQNEQSVRATLFTMAMHWASICYCGEALEMVNFKRGKGRFVVWEFSVYDWPILLLWACSLIPPMTERTAWFYLYR